MFKSGNLILAAGLILGGAGFGGGQGLSPAGILPPPAMPPAMQNPRLPPEITETWKARIELTKEASPELYAIQERLKKIEAKMGKITQSFVNKEIGKAEAKAELLPLVEERQKIQNSPNFLAEQMLMQAYLSSPGYQAKVEKLMSTLKARRRSASGK